MRALLQFTAAQRTPGHRLLSKRALAWGLLAAALAYVLEPAYPRFPDVPDNAILLQLKTATGALPVDDEEKPFTLGFVQDGNLHLVSRTWFFETGPLMKPYLEVDGNKQGTVHVHLQPHWRFMGSKCEFPRQFEVVIPAAQWKGLAAIKVSNDSSYGDITAWLPVDPTAGINMGLTAARAQAALQIGEGESRGC